MDGFGRCDFEKFLQGHFGRLALSLFSSPVTSRALQKASDSDTLRRRKSHHAFKPSSHGHSSLQIMSKKEE